MKKKKNQLQIKKLKNGKYTTRINVKVKGAWKTKRVTKDTIAEVEYKVAKLNKKSKDGTLTLNSSLKLFDFCDVYIKTYVEKILSDSTLNSYENAFRELKDYFGNIKLDKIEPLEYQLFINHLGKELAYSTVETRNKKISAMYNKAIMLKYVKSNPTSGVKIAGVDVAAMKLQYLEDDQVAPLKELVEDSMSVSRAVIFLAIQTGMRFGEIIALTWHSINFERQRIVVKNSWDYKKKKTFVPTKTEERRTIFIDDSTVDYLKKYKKWSKEYISNENITNDLSLVFCTRDNQPIDNQSCNKMLKKIFMNISNEHVTLHKLRHTHTVQCLEAGIDIIYVSERLGHADISTTMEYYTHVSKKLRNMNEDRISNYFNKEKTS
ncbi:tyrosine-type recombinase/integrase [Listeria monocytogenes]|nr:site-specific integrase [Listeria monocytogenes]EAD3233774.1 site-specific integrase [Listeria monocytogenes]EAD3583467.1 site-specific integrase [Listeria monocytogenes]EAD9920268.1 site-specific integrase [Listeria monocytogenes]EAD9921069.1 site-specific integrase [Listeria monocytogenes]